MHLRFHSYGADARTVRPYIPIQAELMCEMEGRVNCSNACGDARPVHLRFHSHGADARTVRPYIPIQAGLMCEMEERASCSNTCRDARLVRPLKKRVRRGSKNKRIVSFHREYQVVKTGGQSSCSSFSTAERISSGKEVWVNKKPSLPSESQP